jgi:hypothetical protein
MTRSIKHLAAYLRAADRRLIDGTKQGIHDIAESVILRTPVDTGNLRANWNPSVDSPDTSVTPFNQDSGSGAYAPARSAGSDRAVNRVRRMMRQAVGRVFHLTNNVHYANEIEFMSKSRQAPEGMVRLTGVLAQRILGDAFRAAGQRQIDRMVT